MPRVSPIRLRPSIAAASAACSLIEGHLRELVGTERAQRLVVNGNPLPLYTDGAGRFVRPYAFGHGSNGVQVGSADGKILKRVQFYEANRSQLPPRVLWCWVGTIRRPSSTCISSPPMASTPTGRIRA